MSDELMIIKIEFVHVQCLKVTFAGSKVGGKFVEKKSKSKFSNCFKSNKSCHNEFCHFYSGYIIQS